MPFTPGHKLSKGRKRGIPNRKTQDLIERAKELGIDPFEILLLFAAERWQDLGYDSRTITKYSPDAVPYEVFVIPPDLREKAAAEACQYIHPKRKAIEHSGPDGAAIEIEANREAAKAIIKNKDAMSALKTLEKALDESDSD